MRVNFLRISASSQISRGRTKLLFPAPASGPQWALGLYPIHFPNITDSMYIANASCMGTILSGLPSVP
jgi:hypothetical protein